MCLRTGTKRFIFAPKKKDQFNKIENIHWCPIEWLGTEFHLNWNWFCSFLFLAFFPLFSHSIVPIVMQKKKGNNRINLLLFFFSLFSIAMRFKGREKQMMNARVLISYWLSDIDRLLFFFNFNTSKKNAEEGKRMGKTLYEIVIAKPRNKLS